MPIIDVNEKFSMRIKGMVQGQWVTISTSESKLGNELEGMSDAEIDEVLESALDQFNDVINDAYRDGKNAYIQMGNTSINVQGFNAIEVLFVQDGKEFTFAGG